MADTVVSVGVRFEAIQGSLAELQKKLNNVKPDSGAYSGLMKQLKTLTGLADNFQARMQRGFHSKGDFSAANKELERMEIETNKLVNGIANIKFKDLVLPPAALNSIQSYDEAIKDTKSKMKELQNSIKNGFISDNKDFLQGINPQLIDKSLTQIVDTIRKKVNEAQTELSKLTQKQNVLQGVTGIAGGGLTADTLGSDVFNKFIQQYTRDGKQFTRFRSVDENGHGIPGGGRQAFLEYIKSQYSLTDVELQQAIGGNINEKSFSVISEKLQAAFQAAINTTKGANRGPLAGWFDKMMGGAYNDQLGSNLAADIQRKVAEVERLNSGYNTATQAQQQYTQAEQEGKQAIDAYTRAQEQSRAAAEADVRAKMDGTQQTNALKQSYDQLRSSLQATNVEWMKMQRAQNTFNSMKMAITNFMGFYQVLNLVKRGVKEAMNHIKELDTVMNGIAIVTDMSTSDLWGQIDQYSALAQKYGVTIKGAYEVSKIYYQQGLETADVMTLTNETLKLAKISGLDYATTTDYMTTAIRGFKFEMEDASRVVDVYSALAANTAVSQKELAEAMTRTASSMESVGSTFEETSAMIATVVAVTRETANNIGSAFKSIASRYGELTKDPIKLFDSEGEAMNFNKVDEALKSVGISLQTTDHQFRSFTEVILELSGVWDQLDSAQQRYIATQFAGNRQQSRFLALVSNPELIKANLEVAETSEDTGTLQAIKALDSLESKLNQVQVAYQQFYTSMGIEGVWKGLLDGVRGFIDSLNSLPKMFGKFPAAAIGVVMQIVNAIKSLGNVIIADIAQVWMRVTTDGQSQMQTAGQQAGEAYKTTFISSITDMANQVKTFLQDAFSSTQTKYTNAVQGIFQIARPEQAVQGNQGLVNNYNDALNLAGIDATSQKFDAIRTSLLGAQNSQQAWDAAVQQTIALLQQEGNGVTQLGANLEQLKAKLLELKNAQDQNNASQVRGLAKLRQLGQTHMKTASNVQLMATAINTWGLSMKQSNKDASAAIQTIGTIGSVAASIATGNWAQAIITGITGIVNIVDTMYEDPEERLERLTKEAEEAANKMKEEKANYNILNRSIKKIDELEQKRYESEEAAEEYQQTVDELTSKFPELIAGFDAAGNVIMDTTNTEQILANARKKTAQATLEAYQAELKQKEEEDNKKRQAVQDLTIDFPDLVEASVSPSSSSEIGKVMAARDQLSDSVYLNDLGGTSYNTAEDFSGLLGSFMQLAEASASSDDEDLQDLYKAVGEYITTGGDYYYDVADMSKILQALSQSSNKEVQAVYNALKLAYTSVEEVPRDEAGNILINTVEDFSTLMEALMTTTSDYNNLSDKTTDAARAKLSSIYSLKAQAEKWLNNNQPGWNDDHNNSYYAYFTTLNDSLDKITNAQNEFLEVSTDNRGVRKKLISAYQDNAASEKGYWEYYENSTGLVAMITKQLDKEAQFDKEGKMVSKTEQALHKQQQAAEQFWLSLTPDEQTLFNKMYSNSYDYGYNEFANVFGETDYWGLVENTIQTWFTDGVNSIQERLLNNFKRSQNISLDKNVDPSKFSNSDFLTKYYELIIKSQDPTHPWTRSREDYLTNVYKKVEEYSGQGLRQVGEAYGNAALDLFDEINKLSYNDPQLAAGVFKKITEAGLTTYEGLDEIAKYLEDNGIGIDLTDLRNTIVPNIALALQTATDQILTDWEKETKDLVSALTKGVSMKDAGDLISKAKTLGVDLNITDFTRNGDKLVMTQEKFIDFVKALWANTDATVEKYEETLTEFTNDLTKFLGEDYTITSTETDKQDEFIKFLQTNREAAISLGFQLTDFFQVDDKTGKLLEDASGNLIKKDNIDWNKLDIAKILQNRALEIRNYKDAAGKAIDSITDAGNFALGKYYSDIEKGTEYTVEELKRIASMTTFEKTDEGYRLKAIHDSLNKAYSSLISDIFSKGLENIDLNSYEGLIDNEEVKAQLQQYIANGDYTGFVLEYAKLAGKSIDETNDLYLQAIEKEVEHTGKSAQDALKNFSFLGNGLTSATGEELKTFLNIFDISMASLINEGIATLDTVTGEYLVDWNQLQARHPEIAMIDNAKAIIDDSFNNYVKSVIDAIKKGLSGTLNNVEVGQLETNLASLGVNVDLQWTRTAEGMKLAENSAMQLYLTLKSIDTLQADLVFDELSKSLKENNDHYKTMNTTLDRINELTQLVNSENAKANPARLNQYKAELAVAKEIYAIRSTSEDKSLAFMDEKLPGALNNPTTYLSNISKALGAFKTAMETTTKYLDVSSGKITSGKGLMSIEDFTNIVNELNRIAGLSGELKIAGYTLDGNAKSASALINAGMNALATVDGGEVKVNLGALGIDFETGMSDMSTGFNQGLQEMAKSQVQVLDGLINLLETIVAMQELGDLDADGNGIDVSELFTDTVGDPKEWQSASITAQGLVKNILDAAKDGTALKDALEKMSINGHTLYDILNHFATDKQNIAQLDQQSLAAILNSFYQLSQSDEFDLEKGYESLLEQIQEVFSGQTLEQDLIINLDDKTSLYIHPNENGEVVVEYTDIEGNTKKTEDILKEKAQERVRNRLKQLGVKDNEMTIGPDGKSATAQMTINDVEYTIEVVDGQEKINIKDSNGKPVDIGELYKNYAEKAGADAKSFEEWQVLEFKMVIQPKIEVEDQKKLDTASQEAMNALKNALLGGDTAEIRAKAQEVGIKVEDTGELTFKDLQYIAELAGIEYKNIVTDISASYESKPLESLIETAEQHRTLWVDIKANDPSGVLGLTSSNSGSKGTASGNKGVANGAEGTNKVVKPYEKGTPPAPLLRDLEAENRAKAAAEAAYIAAHTPPASSGEINKQVRLSHFIKTRTPVDFWNSLGDNKTDARYLNQEGYIEWLTQEAIKLGLDPNSNEVSSKIQLKGKEGMYRLSNLLDIFNLANEQLENYSNYQEFSSRKDYDAAIEAAQQYAEITGDDSAIQQLTSYASDYAHLQEKKTLEIVRSLNKSQVNEETNVEQLIGESGIDEIDYSFEDFLTPRARRRVHDVVETTKTNLRDSVYNQKVKSYFDFVRSGHYTDIGSIPSTDQFTDAEFERFLNSAEDQASLNNIFYENFSNLLKTQYYDLDAHKGEEVTKESYDLMMQARKEALQKYRDTKDPRYQQLWRDYFNASVPYANQQREKASELFASPPEITNSEEYHQILDDIDWDILPETLHENAVNLLQQSLFDNAKTILDENKDQLIDPESAKTILSNNGINVDDLFGSFSQELSDYTVKLLESNNKKKSVGQWKTTIDNIVGTKEEYTQVLAKIAEEFGENSEEYKELTSYANKKIMSTSTLSRNASFKATLKKYEESGDPESIYYQELLNVFGEDATFLQEIEETRQKMLDDKAKEANKYYEAKASIEKIYTNENNNLQDQVIAYKDWMSAYQSIYPYLAQQAQQNFKDYIAKHLPKLGEQQAIDGFEQMSEDEFISNYGSIFGDETLDYYTKYTQAYGYEEIYGKLTGGKNTNEDLAKLAKQVAELFTENDIEYTELMGLIELLQQQNDSEQFEEATNELNNLLKADTFNFSSTPTEFNAWREKNKNKYPELVQQAETQWSQFIGDNINQIVDQAIKNGFDIVSKETFEGWGIDSATSEQLFSKYKKAQFIQELEKDHTDENLQSIIKEIGEIFDIQSEEYADLMNLIEQYQQQNDQEQINKINDLKINSLGTADEAQQLYAWANDYLNRTGKNDPLIAITGKLSQYETDQYNAFQNLYTNLPEDLDAEISKLDLDVLASMGIDVDAAREELSSMIEDKKARDIQASQEFYQALDKYKKTGGLGKRDFQYRELKQKAEGNEEWTDALKNARMEKTENLRNNLEETLMYLPKYSPETGINISKEEYQRAMAARKDAAEYFRATKDPTYLHSLYKFTSDYTKNEQAKAEALANEIDQLTLDEVLLKKGEIDWDVVDGIDIDSLIEKKKSELAPPEDSTLLIPSIINASERIKTWASEIWTSTNEKLKKVYDQLTGQEALINEPLEANLWRRYKQDYDNNPELVTPEGWAAQAEFQSQNGYAKNYLKFISALLDGDTTNNPTDEDINGLFTLWANQHDIPFPEELTADLFSEFITDIFSGLTEEELKTLNFDDLTEQLNIWVFDKFGLLLNSDFPEIGKTQINNIQDLINFLNQFYFLGKKYKEPRSFDESPVKEVPGGQQPPKNLTGDLWAQALNAYKSGNTDELINIANELGVNLMQGVADGEEEGVQEAITSGELTAQDILQAIQAALQEKSPSKATAEMGRNLTAGLALGIKENGNTAIAAAEQLAQQIIDVFKKALQIDGNNLFTSLLKFNINTSTTPTTSSNATNDKVPEINTDVVKDGVEEINSDVLSGVNLVTTTGQSFNSTFQNLTDRFQYNAKMFNHMIQLANDALSSTRMPDGLRQAKAEMLSLFGIELDSKEAKYALENTSKGMEELAGTPVAAIYDGLTQVTGAITTLADAAFTSVASGLDGIKTALAGWSFPTLPDGSVIIGDSAPAAKGTIGPAQATGTLMGELGPELYVSGGRYHIAGQNGAEFVNLPDDAIVFNHLQTKKLLQTGAAGRGTAITNERKAVAFAKGTGPAKASANALLTTLKQLREMWRNIAGLNTRDLAGLGGGGGGGGGNNNFVKELEKWFNLLQQIAKLEKEITHEEQLRSKLESDRVINGNAIYQSQRQTLDALREQIRAQQELANLQHSQYDIRRQQLAATPFGSVFGFDDEGVLQYRETNANGEKFSWNGQQFDSALEYLSEVSRQDDYGRAMHDPKEQIAMLVNAFGDGILSYMQYDAEGNEIKNDPAKQLEAFYSRLEGHQTELTDLWEGYQETENTVLDLQTQENEILQTFVDNQIEVQNNVLEAIESREQAAIDEAQKERDAFSKSQEALIDGLSKQLDKERKMYETQQASEDLNKMRRQLAILQRSGGSQSQIRSLQEQINSASQDAYFDAQQQQIDALKEASDQQIERMDTQIELMTETLEYQKENGLFWPEVTQIMQQSPEEIMNFIQTYNPDYRSKSELEINEDLRQLKNIIEQWTGYRDEENAPSVSNDEEKTDEAMYQAWENLWTNNIAQQFMSNIALDQNLGRQAQQAMYDEFNRSEDMQAAEEAALAVYRNAQNRYLQEHPNENPYTPQVTTNPPGGGTGGSEGTATTSAIKFIIKGGGSGWATVNNNSIAQKQPGSYSLPVKLPANKAEVGWTYSAVSNNPSIATVAGSEYTVVKAGGGATITITFTKEEIPTLQENSIHPTTLTEDTATDTIDIFDGDDTALLKNGKTNTSNAMLAKKDYSHRLTHLLNLIDSITPAYDVLDSFASNIALQSLHNSLTSFDDTSSVTSAWRQLQQSAGQQTTNIVNINNPIVKDEDDIQLIKDTIDEYLGGIAKRSGAYMSVR